MAHTQHTLSLANLEEAVTVLFCLIDDPSRLLNPSWRSHDSLKRLSDSDVLALALFQQLRSVESERSFLRDAGLVLTPVGGQTRVSDRTADEGSPHNAGSNTKLPAGI